MSFEAFVRALPASLRSSAEDTPEVADALARALSSARSAWPELVDDEALAGRLGQCILATDTLPDALEQLHANDLALALGCARGEVAAIRAFATGRR